MLLCAKSYRTPSRRVRFHITLTHSSWPNQVGLWFSKIQRDVIPPRIDLRTRLVTQTDEVHPKAYVNPARLFRWTYTGPPLRIP